MQIEVGGTVLGDNRAAFVGSGIGTTGAALVNNANSRWTGLNALYVGGNATGAGGTGTLIIADTAEVGAASATVWATGAIHLDNGVLRPGSLNLAGGRLEGEGSVILNGSLTNSGIIAPGNTTGLLALAKGNFMQTASGILAIDLGGIHSGEFDRLEVHRGNGSLAGGLQVSLVDGFLPTVGNVFEFLWVEEVLSGAFDPALITVPALPGRQWNFVQRRGAVRLEVLAATFISGDYNANGVVDAADYIVWRKTDGTPAGYNAWRAHFGQTAGSGSGASANAAVPEPATLVLLILAAAGWCLWRCRAALKVPQLVDVSRFDYGTREKIISTSLRVTSGLAGNSTWLIETSKSPFTAVKVPGDCWMAASPRPETVGSPLIVRNVS